MDSRGAAAATFSGRRSRPAYPLPVLLPRPSSSPAWSGPAELGIGAAAVAVHVLLWVGVNALFADAIVQRPELDETRHRARSGRRSRVGFAAAALQAASGWLLAAALARSPPDRACRCCLPCRCPWWAPAAWCRAMLTRGRAYKVLAGRAVIGQGLGHRSPGSPRLSPGQGPGRSCCSNASPPPSARSCSSCGRAGAPALCCAARRSSPCCARGCHCRPATLVQQSRYRVFALLIGGTAGTGRTRCRPSRLPLVRHRAGSGAHRALAAPASSIFGAATRSSGVAGERRPARLPGRPGVVPGDWRAGARPPPLRAGGAWPGLGALSRRRGPAAPARWSGCSSASPGGVAAVARGGARYSMLSQLGVTAATLGGTLLLRPATPLGAVAVWAAAQVLVSPYLLWTTARLMRAGWLRQHRPGLPALALAVTATLLAAGVAGALQPGSPWAVMAARLGCLCAIYGSGAALLLRGRRFLAAPMAGVA